MKKSVLILVLLSVFGFSTNLDEGIKAYNDKNYAKAVKIFEELSNLGNIDAQYNLGQMYSDLVGVKHDYQKAIKFYLLASNQGMADAQLNLGSIYENDEIDYAKAIYYYELSANQGNFKAQYNLGRMYEKGKGVNKDYKKAIQYYTLSANQNYAEALVNLGIIYYNGSHGVKTNKIKTYQLWMKAVKQGDQKAQNNLDVLCKESPWACK